MTRVTLRGNDLDGFRSPGPNDHVKVFFPESETGRISRDFTPSDYRAGIEGDAELDIDFFLHDDGGPASTWAAEAEIGDALAIAGPRGSALAPTGVDRVILVGDETALPAVRRWLRAFPSSIPVTCLLVADDESTRRYLDDLPQAKVAAITWFSSGEAAELEAALRTIEPGACSFSFLAGEANALIPLRRYLRRELQLTPDQVVVSGYWRRGESAYDHHAPVDPSDPE